MTEFRQGQIIYDRSGNKYEFSEVLSGERALCRQIYLADQYDGETEEYPADAPTILPLAVLSAKPPVAVVSAELQELQSKVAEARKALSEANADLATLERERDERLKRLQDHPKLQRLEDFLAGNITHMVVTPGYGFSVEIKTFDEFLIQRDDRGRNEGVKLLSLFGRSNGDIEWMVNRWYDGSGAWTTAQPFTSYDEAFAYAAKLVEAEWGIWRAEPDKYRWLANPIKVAEALGLPVPKDAREAHQQALASALQAKVEQARAELAKAEGELQGVAEAA